MRFRNILVQLKQCKNNLVINKASSYSNMLQIKNFSSLMDSLLALYEYPYFRKYFNLIKDEMYFNKTVGDTLNLSSDKFHRLETTVNELKKNLDMLIEFLENYIKPQNPNTVSFKLFELSSFEEFSSFNDDLFKVILRPLTSCGISVDMGELEAGSRWQSIIFKSTCAMYLFISLVRASTDFVIHDLQKERVLNDLIKTYEEMGNDIKDFDKLIKKQNDNKIQLAVNTVISDFSDFECPEDEKKEYEKIQEELKKKELQNDLEFSIKKMGIYIDKGLEIYQALDVPEEKRFPLPNYKELLEQKKLILLDDSANE